MTWVFAFQKKKEEPKHLKTIYLSNYLNIIKQKKQFVYSIIQNKSDQIMVEDAQLHNIIFEIYI